MKKIKMLSVLALLGVMATSLVGCDNTGSSSQTSGTDNTNTTSDVTNSSDSSSSTSDTTSDIDDIVVPVQWEMNAVYTKFQTNRDSAEGLVANSGSFISNEGKFRIGAVNAVNIMPVVYGVDMLGQVVPISELDKNDVDVKLYDQSNDEELNYSDYFLDNDFDLLKSIGSLKFKEDIDESKPRNIKLVFSYLASDDKDSFKDLTLEISIVDDGYNITDAKQLVLIDNAKSSESDGVIYSGYEELKKEVLGVSDLTGVRTSYEDFIIFNDITLSKEDLPSTVMWSEEINANVSEDSPLYGTLIDWLYVYEHELNSSNEGSDSFNLYGNYNRISLGEDFPWIRSVDNYNDPEPSVIEAGDGATASVNSHATLFGNDAYDYANINYNFNIVDLAVTGNQGVGSSQIIDINNTPEDKSDDAVCGGLLFSKSGCILNFDNVNISKFFTINVNNGGGNKNTLTNRQGERVTLNVVDSRLSDCFSTMLFNYSESLINVESSVLEKSGGFLFINQALALDNKDSWAYDLSEEEKALLKGSDVIVDSESILNNLVTGEGGWFDIYGVEPAVANIKNLVEPAMNKIDKGMFNSDSRMNSIVLTMNSNMETAGALSGNMNALVKIGGITYLDYQDGKEEMDQAMSSVDLSNQLTLASLLTAATSYDYGASFFAKYPTVLLSNGKNEEGSVYYNTVYGDVSDLSPVTLESMIKTAVGMGSIETSDGSKMVNKYLSLFYYFGTSPSIPSDLSKIASDYASFNGSNAYNLVVELFNV